ncbi:MAG: transcription antitermination factor NusB [Oscillospiraceae bacterium]|nr:transcription antitermination factor NusB [Oscillospiraceae bacterium]
MKLSRSQKREGSFLLLYQSTLNDSSIDDIVSANVEEFEMLLGGDEVIVSTAKLALDNTKKADEIINKYSPKRKIERISKIPLSIMRLALYEMDCLPDTGDDALPDKVAINEAIELCKKYAGESDSKFISGLLGNYYREKHGGKFE